MPIAIGIATRITGQFSCLPYYASWDENAVRNIAEIIAETSTNENFGMRLAARWLRASTELPTPKALLDLAAELHQDEVSTLPQADHGCDKCGGYGYESYWGLTTTEFWPNGGIKYRQHEVISYDMTRRPDVEAQVDGITQRVGTFVRHCSCSQGRRIREAQLRQKAIQADAAGKKGNGRQSRELSHV